MSLDRTAPSANAQFDGSIPELYDRYLGPLLFEPYAVDLARRLAKLRPRNVLEVAAGTGIVTRRLLDVLPRGSRLTVTDLNEPMLEHARRRVGEDPRLSWRQADALDLPFDNGAFDNVVCQFGLMFFPDKAQGMREFHRVLSPGGHLLLNVWDSLGHNPLGAVTHATIAEFFPVDPPEFYKTPFGFHDVAELRKAAADAGFRDVEIETVAFEAMSPSAAEAAKGLVRGNPVVNAIRERAPERLEEIERRTSQRLAERYGSRPLRIPMQAHVMTAAKAG